MSGAASADDPGLHNGQRVAARVVPTFVLLFGVSPGWPARHPDPAGASTPDGLVLLDARAVAAYREHVAQQTALSLLSRNAAIDLHLQPSGVAAADARATASWAASDAAPMPRDTLPLLVTPELLCLERCVLRGLLDRSQAGRVGTIDELVTLRRDIIDGLEEYYGTLARTHGYTAEATARGERLFGIDDLFESVVDRVEAPTFEITTRNQQTVNRIGFWLTILFGAIETGFVASGIATWYYADDLRAVLAWTVGVTALTALAIAALLRRAPRAAPAVTSRLADA